MRAHAFRLTPRADLKAELARIVAANGLAAGCVVSCVGSLSRARLRMPGVAGEADAVLELDEPMEIVGVVGTLSPDGLHVHIALSRRDGSCVGGHVLEGCVINTTAELVIGELEDALFRRTLDPATGYQELSVEPREAP